MDFFERELYISQYAGDSPYQEMMPGREIISTEQYEMFKYHSNHDNCSISITENPNSPYIVNSLQKQYESDAPYKLLTSGKDSFGAHMKFLTQVVIIHDACLTKSLTSDINFMTDLKALKNLYNIKDRSTDFRTITLFKVIAPFIYFPAVTYHFTNYSGEVMLPTELSNFPCSMKTVNFMALIPKKGVKVSYRNPIGTPPTDTLIKDWKIVISDKNEVASNQKIPDDFIIKDVVLNEEDKILMGKAVYAYALKFDRLEELRFAFYNAPPLLPECLFFYELWLPDDIRYDYLREMNLIELIGSTIKLRETVKRELLLMIASERSCRDFHY